MDNKLLTLIFFGQLTLLDDVWQLITFKMTTYDLNIWLEQKHEKQIRHMTWTKNTTNGQHMTSIHVCTRGISCGKKMVATMLRNKMCMQPMNIHSPKNVHIFFLGGVEGISLFLSSHDVSNMFSFYSQWCSPNSLGSQSVSQGYS
jgi:hypothetical protein